MIPGTNPELRVIETNAWRAEGIPAVAIGYHKTLDGIEIVRLTLDARPLKPATG